MLKFKFLPLLGALAGFALVAGGSDFARADVVENFGATAPSNFSSCSFKTGSGDEGYVCPSGATYTTTNNDVLTATGYTGVFATAANITWKPSYLVGVGAPPANSFDESGLGQNTAAPFTGGTANACDDPPGNVGGASTPCEVGVGRSLEVTSSLYAITDISVGSVQSGAEVFQLYASTSSGTLSGGLLGTFSSGGGQGSAACSTGPGGSYDGTGVCTFNFSASLDYLAVGIVELTGLTQGGVVQASDSLITAVSVAPAPPIGQGLPVLLAVGGLLFGARLWGRSKKHRELLGADTPLAAA